MLKDSLEYLFVEHFPSWNLIIWMLPCSYLLGCTVLYFSGFLKLKKNIRTGLTRKLFHFVIFILAGIIQYWLGLSATLVYGGGISLVVLTALCLNEGSYLYEALAREKDAPYRSRYIILPYLATLLGGLISNLFFAPHIATLGYFVTGFGDAIGEPVGVKWGKNKYRVPSFFFKHTSYRSLQGSFAVWITTLMVFFFFCFYEKDAFSSVLILKIFLSATVFTLIEAISPHGWDNLTTMLAGVFLGFFLLY